MSNTMVFIKDKVKTSVIYNGRQGETGPAPELQVGTVTTLPAGSNVTFEIVKVSDGVYKVNVGIPEGPQGKGSATVSIGDTITGEPGTNASVSNTGTITEAILNFTIPRGNIGPAPVLQVGTVTTLPAGTSATFELVVVSEGVYQINVGIPKGIQGIPGEAATIAVGTTTTLSPDNPATVNNSGNSKDAIFNFGIPQGRKGDMLDYTMIAPVTVANTLAETSLLGQGSEFSSKTLAANTVKPGDIIYFKMGGRLTTPGGAPGTSRVKVKLGNTVIVDSTTNLIAGFTNAPTNIEGVIVFKGNGANIPTVGTYGIQVWGTTNQGNIVGRAGYTDPANIPLFDNTVDHDIDITTQFSNSAVSIVYSWGYISVMTTKEYSLGAVANNLDSIIGGMGI